MPDILVIDDSPVTAEPLIRELRDLNQVAVEFQEPHEVTIDSVRKAAVVVTDFVLNEGRWAKEHPNYGASRQPQNGLALTAVLRSHVDQRFAEEPVAPAPVAFVLHTAQINRLAYNSRILEKRLHTLARLNDLEWVFDKSADAAANARGIAAIASAVDRLRRIVEDEPPRNKHVAQLLNVDPDDQDNWQGRAWQSVVASEPPIHDYFDQTTGFSLLRWMLQRVLPYSCFLLSVNMMAARLNLQPDWLRSELTSESRFSNKLNEFRYTGMLATFTSESLFWRVGVEQTLADLEIASPFDYAAIPAQLQPFCSQAPVSPGFKRPVLVLSDGLVYTDDIADIDDAERIYPDDWPFFADAPYTRKSIAAASPEVQELQIP